MPGPAGIDGRKRLRPDDTSTLGLDARTGRHPARPTRAQDPTDVPAVASSREAPSTAYPPDGRQAANEAVKTPETVQP